MAASAICTFIVSMKARQGVPRRRCLSAANRLPDTMPWMRRAPTIANTSPR
jgi:hypothetical protein